MNAVAIRFFMINKLGGLANEASPPIYGLFDNSQLGSLESAIRQLDVNVVDSIYKSLHIPFTFAALARYFEVFELSALSQAGSFYVNNHISLVCGFYCCCQIYPFPSVNAAPMRVFVSWKAFVPNAGRVPNHCQRLAPDLMRFPKPHKVSSGTIEAATETCKLATQSHILKVSPSQSLPLTSPPRTSPSSPAHRRGAIGGSTRPGAIARRAGCRWCGR